MATSRNIKQQLADLEKKAAELRKIQGKIISDIKAQIAKYDLTPEDLFPSLSASVPDVSAPVITEPPKAVASRKKTPAARVAKTASVPKYMDPKTKKTWNGHGKAPSWIVAASKKGKRDDFLIAVVEEKLAAKNNAKQPKAKALPAAKAKASATPKKAAAVKSAPAKAPVPAAVKPVVAKAAKVKSVPAAKKPAPVKRKAPAAVKTKAKAPAKASVAKVQPQPSEAPAAESQSAGNGS